MAKDCHVLLYKLSRSRSSRWFQVWTREKVGIDSWCVLEMVTYFCGACQGWAPRVDQQRVYLANAPPAPAAPALVVAASVPDASLPASSADGGVGPRVGVANSNAKGHRDAKFEDCSGYMHVGYTIYSNDALRCLWITMDRYVQPVEHEHGKTVVMHKTVQGSREWAIKMAKDTNVAYLTGILDGFRDMDMWIAAGLAKFGGTDPQPNFDDEVAIAIATDGMKFAFALMGCEVLWMWRYSKLPPGVFPLLLDEDSKASCLLTMKEWWEVLNEFEEVVDEEDELFLIWKSLMFPAQPWVRDIFIGCDECNNFADCPDDCEAEVDGFAERLMTTKPCEDAFNVLRTTQRLAKCGNLGRRKRFQVLLRSNILRDCERGRDYGDTIEAKAVQSIVDVKSGFWRGPSASSLGPYATHGRTHMPQPMVGPMVGPILGL
jgi:hypothetical protein